MIRPHRLGTLLLPALLLVAPVPAQTPYGSGTAGSGGFVPSLTSTGTAWIGNANHGLIVTGGLGGAPAAFLLSFNSWNFNLGGTTILVDLLPGNFIATQTLTLGGPSGTPGAGSGTLPLPIPAGLDPSLVGFTMYAQAVVLDLQSGGALAATQGLQIVLRSRPMVFAGTSVGGSSDPHYFVDPLSSTLLHSGGSAWTDNVTDAHFARGGRDLYVGSSIQRRICLADMATMPPSWSVFYSGGGPCYGLQEDPTGKLLYTMTGPAAASFELVALDIDRQSTGYGTVVAATAGISSGTPIERWHLSATGKLAAILTMLSNEILLVDTDAQSPTYMQQLARLPIPNSGSVFTLPNQVRITPDDQLALVLIQNAGASPGEIARLHIPSLQFLDHDPGTAGIQNIGPMSMPSAALGSAPHGFAMTRDGSSVLITGWARGGFAGRLDQDLGNYAMFSYMPFVPGVSLDGAWACDLSSDERILVVGTFPTNPQLHFLDAGTGSWLSSVAIPGASNLYTVRYN